MEHVLITGGSGTIGRTLTDLLQKHGYEVAWMSRKAGMEPVQRFVWDIDEGGIDEEALRWADHVIHLAGAGIADKPWTAQRKQELYDSRVKSANLLVSKMNESHAQIKTFLSIAGIGYYGSGGDQWQHEEDPPASGFVADLCVDWEQAVKPVEALGVRLVTFRVPMVLTKNGGLLERFKFPLKLGIAPYFGNGRNFYSWIHIDDLCRIFLHGLGNTTVAGTYNAAAPHPERTKDFIKSVARGMKKWAVPFPVPAIALRVVMGDRGKLPFTSNRVSNEAISATGFEFQFTSVEAAISDLFRK